SMRQQNITLPVIGGAGGYVIPDFKKGLGDFAEGVLSVAPGNYDLAPELTNAFKERYGYFMVHEALEHAVCLEVLAQALEKAGKADPEAVREALATTRFEGGWCNAMPGKAVDFDETGLNTLAKPLMVQWRGEDLVTVWPSDLARAEAVWGGADLAFRRVGAPCPPEAVSKLVQSRSFLVAFLQAVIDGLLIGGVYAVISSGLTLVFGVMGIINFAQAEFLMLGMFVAYFAWQLLGLDPLIGSLISFVVIFCLGVLVQMTLIQRVLRAPPVAQIFATVGLLIVIENAALIAFGSDF